MNATEPFSGLRLDGSLALLAQVPSSGMRPVSITAKGDLVYVVAFSANQQLVVSEAASGTVAR